MGSSRKKRAMGLKRKERTKERNKLFHSQQETERLLTRSRNSQFYHYHKEKGNAAQG